MAITIRKDLSDKCCRFPPHKTPAEFPRFQFSGEYALVIMKKRQTQRKEFGRAGNPKLGLLKNVESVWSLFEWAI